MRHSVAAFLSVVLALSAFAGDTNDEVGTLTYTAVVEVDGVGKDELYSRAQIWFADTFISAKDVMQLEDREAGRLLGKSVIMYVPKGIMGSDGLRGPIRFTTKVFVKDGRYKYEFTDFVHEGNAAAQGYVFGFGIITTSEEPPKFSVASSKKWRTKKWNEIKATIEAHVSLMILSLETAMATSGDGDDDW